MPRLILKNFSDFFCSFKKIKPQSSLGYDFMWNIFYHPCYQQFYGWRSFSLKKVTVFFVHCHFFFCIPCGPNANKVPTGLPTKQPWHEIQYKELNQKLADLRESLMQSKMSSNLEVKKWYLTFWRKLPGFFDF